MKKAGKNAFWSFLLMQETNGYSGADVRLVCKEAAMRTVRKVFDALENHVEGDLNGSKFILM